MTNFINKNIIYSSSLRTEELSAYNHYNDVMMSAMASQITSLTIVYSTVYSGADERKHQSSASLAFGRGIPCTIGPVPRKMFPFDDVIMNLYEIYLLLTDYVLS